MGWLKLIDGEAPAPETEPQDQEAPPKPMSTTFKDVNGVEWHPKLAAGALMKACRRSNVSLADIIAMRVNIASLVDLIWFSCEKEAAGRGIPEQDFLDNLGVKETKDAIAALFGCVQKDFPDFKAPVKGKGINLPFGLGTLMT